MSASSVLTREIVTDVACPRCAQLLRAQQMCVPVQGQAEDEWVTARRFCPRGCLLVGMELPSPRLQRSSRG